MDKPTKIDIRKNLNKPNYEIKMLHLKPKSQY